jgi:hypothetical protein
MTWVVSAGVVVLFSVVGFGAGFVVGREVGRGEILSAGVGADNLSLVGSGAGGLGGMGKGRVWAQGGGVRV